MLRCGVVLCAVWLAFAAAARAASNSQLRLAAAVGSPVVCIDAGTWAPATAAAGAPGALGLYDATTGTIYLGPRVCAQLAAFQQGYRPHRQLRAWALADAVFVLAHERAHATGIADETAADCAAARTLPQLALRLGASPAYAAELGAYATGAVAGRCA